MENERDKLFSLKDDFGFSEILNNDNNNFTNRSTIHRYRQLLEGNTDSMMLSYLMNYKFQNLEDTKNITFFNQNNVAIKEQYLSKENEIVDEDTIKLNRYSKSKLCNLLNRRESTRKFSKVKISKKIFSKSIDVLLNTKRKKIIGDYIINSRGYASGGGLYPIDVYLLILNVKDIPVGFYRLQFETETLYPLDEKITFVKKIFQDNNEEIENASYVIFYGLDLAKIYPKYGELSLYLALVEVGEMAQLIDLSIIELGLSGYQSGSFNKKYVEKCLNIDGVTKHIVHSQIIGER